MTTINPVPVTRFEDGYIPEWQYRTEDSYMWRDHPSRGYRTPGIPGGPWKLRVTLHGVDRFSGHRTLREARIEASRLLEVRP